MSRTIIDIHVLQTVPPSNLNRDDTGSPKTAQYGGVTRARVSSQAWKRATRKAFESLLDPKELGVRTKRVVDLVANRIAEKSPELTAESIALAEKALRATGIKVEKPTGAKDAVKDLAPQSAYLLFLSDRQISLLADLAISAHGNGDEIDKNAAKLAADSQHSVDLALFGRMVADAADLNVDAAAQVAHAISVHAVENEFDYFTAVDDRSPEDNAGAGMIGTVEFNSSTLYRYATVDGNSLKKHLGSAEATSRAIGAFVRAFVTSLPTGKQNTFANRTLPDAVVVSVRDNQPVNLVGAFEDPVGAAERTGRISQASNRLAEYAQEIDRAYSHAPVATFVVRIGSATDALDALGQSVALDELIASVEQQTAERLQEDV